MQGQTQPQRGAHGAGPPEPRYENSRMDNKLQVKNKGMFYVFLASNLFIKFRTKKLKPEMSNTIGFFVFFTVFGDLREGARLVGTTLTDTHVQN